LKQFEEDKKYLKTDITILNLAKDLETNTRYLSKIINHYKEKNFSNYLNDLRISYAVDKLTNDVQFRKYTIQAIGNEVGFNNAESFAKAFYKNTGIKSSYFIKNIP